MSAAVLDAALAAHDAGLSVMPVKADGSKAPVRREWTSLQHERMGRNEVASAFPDGLGYGLAVIAGAVSGNLEVLDFDDADFQAFVDTCEAAGLGEVLSRVRTGFDETTPSGGRHLAYRCAEIGGNEKLARAPGPNPDRPRFRPVVLIETRGEGGYVVTAPSNGRVHELGKPWRLISGGPASIATITPEERRELHAICRGFDRLPPEKQDQRSARREGGGTRPGDDFRARHATVDEFAPIVEAHGWDLVYRQGEAGLFRRPGKRHGISASFNFDGSGLFYVFSTSTEFEDGRGINPFAVYATLNHGGDFTAAAKALVAEGYGGGMAVADVTLNDDGTADDGEKTAIAISAQDQDVRKVTDEAWRAVEAANDPARFFAFGGQPSRIVVDDDGVPFAQHIGEDRMLHELARVAVWWRVAKDPATGMTGTKHARPPREVARDMLAGSTFPLPTLTRITRMPTFAPDGSLSDEPGYHAAGRTYYHAGSLRVPAVPLHPTAIHVAEARKLIIEDLFGDFPFAGDADRAHAVALLLLPVVRDLIDGPTPLTLIDKPTAGTGASLLSNLVAYVVSGREPAVMTEARDEDEWRKRITATLRGSPEIILIDNLRRALDSGQLSALLTASEWTDRILGVSETIRLPVRAVFVATGNNPAVSSEMSRRIVRIRLDAKRDRPWLRTVFRHPHITAWATENRGRLVAACLTLVRAWIAAGRPEVESKMRLGSFETWSRVMAGVLATAGIPGFLANLREFYDQADVEGNAMRAFVARWWEAYSAERKTAADLFEMAVECGINVGSGTDRSQRTVFGGKLRALRDQHYALDGGDEVRVFEAGVNSKTRGQYWALQAGQVAEPSEPSEPFQSRTETQNDGSPTHKGSRNTAHDVNAYGVAEKGSEGSEGSDDVLFGDAA